MYEEGHGVKQDYSEALKWFRLAAAQGEPRAQTNLGFMYEQGYGVKQDYEESAKWFRLSAAQGFVGAQASLGFMYERGHGVTQDYAEAVKWYRLAAAQGNGTAQLNLGVIYYKGLGVPKDLNEAQRLLKLAADQNVKGANELFAEVQRQLAQASLTARQAQAQVYQKREKTILEQVLNYTSFADEWVFFAWPEILGLLGFWRKRPGQMHSNIARRPADESGFAAIQPKWLSYY